MFKRIVSFVLVVIITFGFVGCATVQVAAPANTDIKLATEDAVPKRVIKKRVFYALWGYVPINENSTADYLRGQDVKKVKVKSYYDVVDYLISAFLGGFTIMSRTVEIEVVE